VTGLDRSVGGFKEGGAGASTSLTMARAIMRGCPSSGLVEAALRSAAGGQADAQSTAAAAQCTAVAPVDEKETVP
jgi:hypothetical protein